MSKRYRSKIIESVSEFVNEVCSLDFTDTALFRGQREDWPLVPKIARLNLLGGFNTSERAMLSEFQHRSKGMISGPPKLKDHWEWLAIAQHHYMATRYLDWSTSALGALWFAVSEPCDRRQSAVVWICTPETDSDFVNPDSPSPFTKGRTLIYRPHHLVDRIRAQNGWFTCHKPNQDDEFIPLEDNRLFGGKLRKIKIPHDNVADFRGDLDRLGINRSTMFPDLDGIARHAEWLHSIASDEL